MVASTNSSNLFIPQSERYQNNSVSKSKSLSDKSANKNQFVKKPENKLTGLNSDTSYKIKIAEKRFTKDMSELYKKISGNKESGKFSITSTEINASNQNEELSSKPRTAISKSTIKSALKLYNILKGDILLENHFDFKTGSVNFFA